MPYISEYKIEEHKYTKGHQHDESYVNGYRIRFDYDGYSYYSAPIDSLDKAMERLEKLKKGDGV